MENFPGCHLEPCNTKVGGNKTNTKVGKHCKKKNNLSKILPVFGCENLTHEWHSMQQVERNVSTNSKPKLLEKTIFGDNFQLNTKNGHFSTFFIFFPCRQHPNMEMCGICSKVREKNPFPPKNWGLFFAVLELAKERVGRTTPPNS